MMRQFTRKIAPFRPLVLALITGCVAACSFDLPTPIAVQKDLSVAYPCQNRPCGCQNADQCWSACCCFSDAEKLVWAKANDVMPPSWFMEKLAANRLLDLKLATQQASAKLDEPKAPGCCCCAKKKAAPQQNLEAKPKLGKNVVQLILRQQKGCQGQTDFLSKLLVYVVPEVLHNESEQAFTLHMKPTLALPAVVLDLPTPPPRV